MVDVNKTFIAFALIGVFVLAMIAFGVTLQEDNNVDQTILTNNVINRTYQGLNTNLSAFSSLAQSQRESFESDIPTAGFGSLLLFSIISGGKVFTGMIVGVYNLIIVIPASLLGISPVVLSVLSALLIITLILGFWRLYKLGG